MNIFEKIYKVSVNMLGSLFKRKPKVMTSQETIDYVLKNNLSIGRYGDGEIDLVKGKGLKFQIYNKELSHKLAKIKTDDNFLVCIPDIFNKKRFNRKVLKSVEYKFWVKNKLMHECMWKKLFNKQLCGDAFISRFYIRYNDRSHVENYLKKFVKLWEDRNVIIVEGENSKIGCENDLLKNAKSIRRIICPSVNAYEKYDEIIKSVKTIYNNGDLVLAALGPTATVLAYDLSREEIQTLDLGHFDIEYEWFLAKAEDKVPVKNKHVNECSAIGNNKSDDSEYRKQIVINLEKK